MSSQQQHIVLQRAGANTFQLSVLALLKFCIVHYLSPLLLKLLIFSYFLLYWRYKIHGKLTIFLLYIVSVFNLLVTNILFLLLTFTGDFHSYGMNTYIKGMRGITE